MSIIATIAKQTKRTKINISAFKVSKINVELL